FFKPIPAIEHIDNRRVHAFECGAKHCNGKGKNGRNVYRYLDSSDATSTSNLKRHAKICWGEETVKAAGNAKDARAARVILAKTNLKDGTITAAFERSGKGKVTYSHRQHTKTESRCIVRWVSESMRPFQIVNDRGFQSLMKTGRPDYHIPSPETISRDVKQVFEHDGALNFATDAWTSPNHRAYIAITIHFEKDGVPVAMLLDILEVAQSHSGLNLAAAFANVLEDFGISDKILSITCDNASNNDTMIEELEDLVAAFPGETNRTRCFAHIINLVAKSVLQQFDIPKAKDGEDLNEPMRELVRLAENLEFEEESLQGDRESDDEGDKDDNVNSLEDEREELSEAERRALKADVQPVCQMLVKV
ncbi:hypothetical protein M378DRAFT_53553, partial [Amanita muscaria Koide BX008]